MIGRPLLRYHGGKWRIAPWVISNFPPHKTFIEVFGGGASVLLRKPKIKHEIYNELDREIVNLFQVVRNHGSELKDQLIHTPYAKSEFIEAYQASDDPVEQARRTIIKSHMGVGSVGATRKTGFSTHFDRVTSWKNYIDVLDSIIERMQGVIILNQDAKSILEQFDNEDTLFYMDPPYVLETRTGKNYRHEMTDQDHIDLANLVKQLKGKVVISGYQCDLYHDIYRGFMKFEKNDRTMTNSVVKECIWISPNAFEGDLFGI